MMESRLGQNVGGFVDTGGLFQRLGQFVTRQLVEAAPEDIAICEFDCRKRQCTQGEWETCERRISKGAGELFPASEDGGGA